MDTEQDLAMFQFDAYTPIDLTPSIDPNYMEREVVTEQPHKSLDSNFSNNYDAEYEAPPGD